MPIEMHRDLLTKAGYNVRFRRDQWVECFASQGREHWRGRGHDEADAIEDVLRQMLPSMLGREMLLERLAALHSPAVAPAEPVPPAVEVAAAPPPPDADRPPVSDPSGVPSVAGVPPGTRWAAARTSAARAPHAFAAMPERGLFVVAEGEVASPMVVDTLRNAIESAPPLSSTLKRKGVPLLVSAIEQANAAVHAAGKSDAALRKAGISLATAIVAGRRAAIACLGDAAIYRLRSGALERLMGAADGPPASKGRTSVAPRARGAKAPPSRRTALGQKKAIEVETSIVTLQPSDTLVLCTPRFRAVLPLEEMGAALAACADPDAAVSELSARAGDAIDGLALVVTIPLEG